jgi:hypothetical protein
MAKGYEPKRVRGIRACTYLRKGIFVSTKEQIKAKAYGHVPGHVNDAEPGLSCPPPRCGGFFIIGCRMLGDQCIGTIDRNLCTSINATARNICIYLWPEGLDGDNGRT